METLSKTTLVEIKKDRYGTYLSLKHHKEAPVLSFGINKRLAKHIIACLEEALDKELIPE